MITFQRENAVDVLDEIVPLAVAHDIEVKDAIAEEFPLNINRAAYIRLDTIGVLRVFTARDGDLLAGYVIMMICPSLRRDGLTIAMEDALYLCPQYRKAGNAVKLLNFVAAELGKECQVVTYHSPTVNPVLGKVLAHLGYTKHSEYYTRRLESWPALQ